MTSPSDDPQQRLQALRAAMAALEAQRATLGDAVVDLALAGMQAQLQAQAAANVPPDLPANGQTTTAPVLDPTQALRLVSILFLDVVGSTALAQQLDPEEIHGVLDGALARFSATVRGHGGRVLQYAGDSLLAGFGCDEVHEDDAECAVRCGLALLADGREVGRQVQAAHGHDDFDVRVGIHSGEVLLGGGVDAEGTIRGSAVNVAARIEQHAPAGGLLISQDTYRLLHGAFDVRPAPPLQAKGIAGPMSTYLVEREKPRGAQRIRRGFDAAPSTLVGRSADLAVIHAALALVRQQRTLQAVTVVGEAGLGKTRLLVEFDATVTGGLHTLPATAHPQGLHQPYGVLRDLLFRRFGVKDSDALVDAKAKLAAGLADLFGERADEQTALLGQLIGLDYRRSPFIAGIVEDSRQLRARAFHAWVEYLRLSCAQLKAPSMLVLRLDDLHWADDGSLDAIAHLANAGRELPLLLLCAARPELLDRRPAWGEGWPAHQPLRLQPLDAGDRQALARALLQPLGSQPDALKLQDLLIEHTAGNPFYMEALLQMLVDQGVLVTTTTPWSLTVSGIQRLQVPGTLVGVLQARLDALLAPQRRALQQASVVGAVFWDQALAALEASATAALPALCKRVLVVPQQPGAFGDAEEFAFCHHLLHEVTYGTVLKRDKREQHERAARWLEARSAGRGAEFAGLIAEHFERAGIADRAAEHWAVAARAASARHVDSAALAHAARALALDPAGSDPQRHFSLLRVQATAWSRRGDIAEHEKAIFALEAFAEAQDDHVMRLIAAQARMNRLCQNADYEQARQLGLQRLAAASDLSPGEAAKTHNTMIMALGRQGRHDEARVHADAALRLAREVGDAYTEASVLNNLSVGFISQRRLAEAQASGEQALAVYQRIGSRFGAAIAMLNLALVAEFRGQLPQARAQLGPLLTLCDAIDQQQIGAQARCNLAGILAEVGEPVAALEIAAEGIRLAERSGDRFIQTTGHAAICDASYRLGRWPQAIEHGRLAHAGYAASGQPADALACQAWVACALQQAGDGEASLAEVEAVLASVAARGGWQDDHSEAALACTRVLLPRHDPRAQDTLAAAHRGLMALAAAFDDPLQRAQFLQSTASRREILALWDRHRLAGELH